MTVANTLTHYDAVLAYLRANLAETVGDSEQPPTPAYALYALSGGEIDGTLGELDDDIVMPFQLNALSNSRQHAQYMQTAARVLLLSMTLTIPGRSVTRILCEDPSGVTRDDELGERGGRLFYTTDGFDIATVPA